MIKLITFFVLSYLSFVFFASPLVGETGLIGSYISNHLFLFTTIYIVAMTHITITCMSLSFHRFHTHKGVEINPVLDFLMQTWLWLITTMNKLDWVSIHVFHHAHSDKEKDPHSPVQKGLAHVFFLGVLDYTKAKELTEVIKIRNTLRQNKYELFYFNNPFLGTYLFTLVLLFSFGTTYGTILAVINFLISPIFAVGGVNALAHSFGYRNHKSTDNSRNLGFLFPLNFMICGELDHNNHHAKPRSCSFRHRWFEFDIGYFYLKLISYVKLAELKNVYNPISLKQEWKQKIKHLIEKEEDVKKRCEQLAQELNISYIELKQKLEDYLDGKKIEIEEQIQALIEELYLQVKITV